MANDWLLLRGLTRESAHWGDFLPKLQAAFPDSKIHCLDLLGSGEFYQQPSACSIAEITEQLRLQALNNGWLNKKIRLLSISLGGMVAWQWMQTYPNDIQSAVLINSSLAGLNPFYQRLRWQCYGKLARILIASDIATQELAVVQLTSNLEAKHEKIALQWAEIQRLRPVSKKNALRQLIAAARYHPTLSKPIPPVLLLAGLGDKLVAPDCSKTISQRYDLPLITHPWAGHDLCIDDADWVIERLQTV